VRGPAQAALNLGRTSLSFEERDLMFWVVLVVIAIVLVVALMYVRGRSTT
jgi:hypothetical protein